MNTFLDWLISLGNLAVIIFVLAMTVVPDPATCVIWSVGLPLALAFATALITVSFKIVNRKEDKHAL